MKRSSSPQIPSKRNKADAETLPAEVERVVTEIIRTLRRGHPARLPGLGTLNPGKPWTFDPEETEPGNDD